jgi:hypothetical protein
MIREAEHDKACIETTVVGRRSHARDPVISRVAP